jgi:hypothetical protein
MTFGHPVTGSHGDTRLTDKALEVAPTLRLSGDGNGGETTPKSELMKPLAEYDLLEEPSVGSTRFFDDMNTVELTRIFRYGVSAERGSSCASDGDEGKTQTSDSMAVEALL